MARQGNFTLLFSEILDKVHKAKTKSEKVAILVINDTPSLRMLLKASFDPTKEVHIKVTRVTEYGERYKLFVIDKGKFEKEYNLDEYGITLSEQNDQLVVDKLNWKGEAKRSGMQMGDIISNFKIENPDRPNKMIVYPFALLAFSIFGYLNYRRKSI